MHEIARSESVSRPRRQNLLNFAWQIYDIALILVTELFDICISPFATTRVWHKDEKSYKGRKCNSYFLKTHNTLLSPESHESSNVIDVIPERKKYDVENRMTILRNTLFFRG